MVGDRAAEGAQRISRHERAVRLTRLHAEQDGIRDALSAYGSDFPTPKDVRLRTQFIRRQAPWVAQSRESADDELANDVPLPDVVSRPPLTRLVNRRTRAIPLYLTAVFTAHAEFEPGRAFVNNHGISYRQAGTSHHSWARLAGMRTGGSTARRARTRRALDQLDAAHLVDLKSLHGRRVYEGFTLLSDDGSEQPFLVPRAAAQQVVTVPRDFFENGWHLVLEPREVVMLLAIMEASTRARGGNQVMLAERVRAAEYGVSGEVYEAIHELDEFGLIRLIDPMERRRRGRVRLPVRDTQGEDEPDERPVPYRFQLRLEGVANDALSTVTKLLRARPVSPRLT